MIPQAIGANDPQAWKASLLLPDRFFQGNAFGSEFAESSGQDNHPFDVAFTALSNERRDGRGWCADDGQVRLGRQFLKASKAR